MKTVYLYDKDTGEYKGRYEAQASPLESNNFIVPDQSTTIAPPSVISGKYQKWIGSAWVLMDDTRGIWYKTDGSIVEIESLSDSIDPQWSRTKPVVNLTLPEQFELVRQALQGAIDDKAKTFSFSGGNALMLYAGFSNPFQPLAVQFGVWEASVWTQAEVYKQEVIAGTKPIVTPEQAVALMPPYPA